MLTLKQASERTGLHVSTLRQAAQKGRLRARRVGYTWLVQPRDLDRFMRERTPHAQNEAA